MRIGPDIIYKCPACEGLIRRGSVLSGNTGAGRQWTDGMAFYPMLPSSSSLLKCPHCSKLLCDKQLIEFGEIDFSFGRKARLYNKPRYGWFEFDVSDFEGPPEKEPDFSSALYESEPSRKEYLDYVSLGVDDAQKERYIRLQVWWNANDARRAAKASVPMEPDEIGNLERLATLMDERDDDDRLLKAEIMRELGRFSEAEAILAKRFPRRLRHASELIRALNEARDTKVAEIVPPQPVQDDYSDAPAKLFPPLLTTIKPSAGPVRPNGRGHPLVIIDARTRKNLFKKVGGYRLGRFGYHFRDALTYIPLHPLAEDSWDDYKHRLDLLLTLLDVALYRTANKTREESTAKLHQLHENAILQLRDDIRDGVIDLDRLNTQANAELFTSRGAVSGLRALITTREIVGKERRKYSPLVSHPAAYCIVWLAHRLLPHWEETVLSESFFSSDDGSRYVEIIAGIASSFLTESSAGDAEKAADEFDRRAWCCYVIDRLLLKMKGLDKDSSSSMDDLEFDWTSPFE